MALDMELLADPRIMQLLIIFIIFGIFGIIMLIKKEWRYKVMLKSYYRIHVVDRNLVLKTDFIPIKGQTYINYPKEKTAWQIPEDDQLIKHKLAKVFYADKRSCRPLKINDPIEQNIIDELKKETNADKIINKIPVISKFYQSKKDIIEPYKIGFAKKIKFNPEFVIDSIAYYRAISQTFTDKIMKNPKSLAELIEQYLPLIVIGCLGAIIFLIYMNRNNGM